MIRAYVYNYAIVTLKIVTLLCLTLELETSKPFTFLKKTVGW